MYPQKLIELLTLVKKGKIAPDEAAEKLKHLPFEAMGFANIDHHRALRTGLPEVIYAPGKTVEQIIKLAKRTIAAGSDVMITRTDKKTFGKIKSLSAKARYNSDARIIQIPASKTSKPTNTGTVLVITAGTSDIPVAEEAALTAQAIGCTVERIFDVGVAGIHRLFAHKDSLAKASVIIVVAGMEGALASVVAGLVDSPVIAVPTSVGYGASFGGLSALLSMLNSCVPGVTVVNIDNGFGAACAAIKILNARNPKK